ncbi:glycosyl hydrolase-related protein [Paenibacillus alkaliterrae]|uniref:alpha-mannosidase n=1 Tax=Paenibacillus alkaliterrae TaxID=320909 RepID=UPI001F23D835|nr:glycoside hydrolase family 38 C-terminal domain-containing protein [Paenibacillus alkaliterrae]MCF2938988.1 glycosyl hydrolase-related protein [Paenibacillus alkaliterrae]
MPYETVSMEQLKSMLERLKEHIYKPLSELNVTAWVTPEPVPYEARMSGQRIELSSGDRWGKLWDCAWFHFTGQVNGDAKGLKVVLLIDVNGELCLVDEEGSPVQGLTNINSEYDYSLGLPGKRVVSVSDCSIGNETVDLWGDAGCNDLFGRFRSGTLKEAVVAVCREDVRQLYYDTEVLLETADRLPKGSARRERMIQALYDVSLLLTELTEDRVAKALSILGEQLAKRGGDPVLTISAVGHAHLDLAWLWPIRETIRKGARTFSTALMMMERYPDYVFGASQPQLYDWMKTHYPKLYARIKERVLEGRWELQGAMWVESDTNVPGGESLIRQILYGKRYFQEEFGQEMKTLWMPDVFGYTASLPQILSKSGVDYMMTQKLSWSKYNRHPHHTFVWEGIDGSRVLTHMPPEDTYNSPAAPRSIVKAENEYLDKNVSEECLMLFGIGDGGGGPGEEHLERLMRQKNLLGLSPVVQEPSLRFFEKLAEGADRYQTWSGELYLEKHQGTLTSQARNKRYNRKLEKALRELEYAAVLAGERTGKPYPSEELELIWKEVLLYQFHDILPGSSIKRVYDESLERYAALSERVEQMIAEAYEAAAEGLPAEAGTAAFFNSLSWEREEWLHKDGCWFRIRVPAMGYALANTDMLARSKAETAAAGADVDEKESAMLPDSRFPDMRASTVDRIIENDLLAVTFAEDYTIVSVWDKEYGREVIPNGQKANELCLYHDDGDAWDFRQDYRQSGAAPLQTAESAAFQEGPKSGLILHYRFGHSSLTQKVVLTQGSRRIDFVTNVDWKESGKMLRTSFPVDIRSDSASCEIQFGYIKRPTHRNTMWDYAKDEICAHHWMDLSEPDYGVALLNDCKYGHRAWQNVLDLNLLRSTAYPDPEADRAEHSFTYSLYPHKGDHIQAEVYKRGYELNVPLRSVDLPRSSMTGMLSEEQSFIRIGHPNVMVETVKQAEDGEDLIVRLYETAGTHLKTTFDPKFRMSEAWLADLMEAPIERLDSEDGAFTLSFTPFEIKTIRLTKPSL